MNVTIDWERAEAVFGAILDRFRNKEYPFDRVQPPQRPEKLPRNMKYGSREHALYLFCLCYYMRGKINSDTAVDKITELYERYPRLFDPHKFTKEKNPYTAKTVKQALLSINLTFQLNQNSRFWAANFRKLVKYWEGDPLNIYKDANNSQLKLEMIFVNNGKREPSDPYGFYGFGFKMTSMLTYFYVDAEFLEIFSFSLPIDFHLFRLFFATEVLKVKGAKSGTIIAPSKISAYARELTKTYTKKHNVHFCELADALWLYARAMCRHHPGNTTNHGQYRARRTKLKPVKVEWTEAQTRAYAKSCGMCCVEELCKYNIPSAASYVQGNIVLRGERQKPNQLNMFY